MAGERTLPGLGLTGYWTLGSNGWNTGMDINIRLLSALCQLRVLSQTTALPGSPTDGDMYIVPSGGDANKVAIRDNGSWVYFIPEEGYLCWVEDDNEHIYFDGSTWVAFTGSGISDAPSDGDQYARKDGAWEVVAAGAAALNDLTDVNTTGFADGEVLTYSTGASGWISAPPAGGSVALDDLTNVDAVTGLSDGDVLTYNLGTTTWVASAPASGLLVINDQTASYPLVLADAGKYVRMNVASANNLTVPLNATQAFAIGTEIIVRQKGAGQTTVVATGGVTINTAETLKLRKQGSTASLIKVATDEWDLTGDLELA